MHQPLAQPATVTPKTTHHLTLVQEGVFPVTRNHRGELLEQCPNTGWHHAGTIQGEGKLAGVPSLFIRLAGCNLRCMWQMADGSVSLCDTAYASFHTGQTRRMTVDEVVNTVRHNIGSMRHVVITGGEPMLQSRSLTELCRILKTELHLHITLETNGTLFDKELAPLIDLVSLSPKLQNATPTPASAQKMNMDYKGTFAYHAEIRKNTEAIQQWMDYCRVFGNDFQLKFVVAHAAEVNEIKTDFLNELTGWQPSDILLMPLGGNRDQLAVNTPMAVLLAVINGWRFAPRLHVDLWGNRAGV